MRTERKSDSRDKPASLFATISDALESGTERKRGSREKPASLFAAIYDALGSGTERKRGSREKPAFLSAAINNMLGSGTERKRGSREKPASLEAAERNQPPSLQQSMMHPEVGQREAETSLPLYSNLQCTHEWDREEDSEQRKVTLCCNQ